MKYICLMYDYNYSLILKGLWLAELSFKKGLSLYTSNKNTNAPWNIIEEMSKKYFN